MSQFQRQMLLTSYLLAHEGPIPPVMQFDQDAGGIYLVQFSRGYLAMIASGEQPHRPEDLKSIDKLLEIFDTPTTPEAS